MNIVYHNLLKCKEVFMRRCIASVLCIALCFGLFAVPAFAFSIIDTYEYAAVSIWDALSLGWEGVKNGFTWLGDLVAPSASDLSTAYNSYVSDLDASLGSHLVFDEGYCIPLRLRTASYSDAFVSGINWSASWHDNKMPEIIFNAPSFIKPPANGYVKFYYSFSFDNAQRYQNSDYYDGSSVRIMGYSGFVTCSTSDILYSEDWYLKFKSIDPSLYSSVTGSCGWFFKPYDWGTNSNYNGISSPVSRAPSILTTIMQSNTTNNAYYIGTKDTSGAITNVYTTNIFNEETKVFTVPGETPVEHTVTNWNYDYSTRTYNCTDGTNNYVVTYGDDHITVTVPDGSGGTVSTNYYYIHQTPVPTPAVPGSDTTFPDSSSDNYEDDPNTTGGFFSTVWKAFKDGLASLIAGIIKGLFKGIKALIDGITSVFSGLVSGFFGFVTSFFGSFGTGPGQVGQFFGGGVVDLD